jgi:hypothetical protein
MESHLLISTQSNHDMPCMMMMMQLEPQLWASQRDVAQTSANSVMRDSRALSPNKCMSEWRVKKFGDLYFMIHWYDSIHD